MSTSCLGLDNVMTMSCYVTDVMECPALSGYPFHRYAQHAGLTKQVYPHMLRHTMATTLLANGCPIGHIRTMLGHEHLTTTCRYYLGVMFRCGSQGGTHTVSVVSAREGRENRREKDRARTQSTMDA
jgi:integrase